MRPTFWPHALELARRSMRAQPDGKWFRARATRWAESRAQNVDDVLPKIGWDGRRAYGIATLLGADELARAQHRANTCPVRMGGAGDIRLLYCACESVRARRVLETGVAYGWSSLAILKSIHARPSAMLASVDMPYRDRDNEDWVGVVVPAALRRNWVLLRSADRNGIKKAIKRLGGRIDVCHYDSDKTYHGRVWAYPLLWDALRPGGIFISDDIQDNLAFCEFVEAISGTVYVVAYEYKFAGICVKRKK